MTSATAVTATWLVVRAGAPVRPALKPPRMCWRLLAKPPSEDQLTKNGDQNAWSDGGTGFQKMMSTGKTSANDTNTGKKDSLSDVSER